MQGSFWKTVALVAVIGVGSLAVLEVQDRLQKSPSALEASTSSTGESLTKDLNAIAENSVNADLSESDFDKMLKAGFASTASGDSGSPDADSSASASTGAHMAFDLSEPNSAANQTFDTSPDDSAAQFTLADSTPNPLAGNVDTHVKVASLSDQGNPFEFASDTTSNQQDQSDNHIEPVGFVADDQAPSEAAASPFAAFDPDAFDGSAADRAASDNQATTDRTANLNTAEETLSGSVAEGSSREVGQMQFYAGNSPESAASGPQATVQASPITFEQDFPAERIENGPASGGGFEQFPADDSDVDPLAGSSNPFPGFSFDDDPPAATSAPSNLPNQPEATGSGSPFFQAEDRATDDVQDEFVPLPRDEFGGPEFDATRNPGNNGGSFDDSPAGTHSLPFAEDSEINVPVLDTRPAGSRDDGLEIPPSGFDRDRQTFDRENDIPGFDARTDFRDFPAAEPERDNTFDSRPPIRTTPASPWDPSPLDPGPIDPNPIDRRDLDRQDLDRRDLDRRDQTFGRDELVRPENDAINPGFNSAPGRIPTIEDRSENRRNPSSGNPPLSIDPGFGRDRGLVRDRNDSGRDLDFGNRELGDRDLRDREFDDRDLRDRSLSDETFDRGFGSQPIREFGNSNDTRDFPSRTQPEDSRFRNEPIGSGPLNGRREFGGSSTDRIGSDLPNASRRSGGDIRQVASVMRPKLVLEKNAPENATVGTPLQYSITIRNDGDAPAYDVVVEDEVTDAGRIDAAKPQASRTNDGERLVWEFDSIAPGTEKEIQVQVTPTGEGMLDGIATVKFKSRVKATTTITAPRLQLRMDGPAKVRLGQKVQYLYTIVNEGSGEARSVFVRTVLPQNGGLRHPQGQDLEYEIPLMAPGERREILLSVVAGEPGSQQAQAIVTSRNGSKDEATWSTEVVGAQLQMLRRGPKRRFVSKTARYENIVTNETDFDAVNARVVEHIPPGMEFKKAGQGGRYDAQTRTVSWGIQRLAPKATTTLQLELEPRVAGQQDSRVIIEENIGAQSDDYVSTTLVEDLHNVSATISQLEGPVALGEGFGFTVTVDNRGTADATDVELRIQVPREIKVEGAGTQNIQAGLMEDTNTVVYRKVVRIRPDQKQDFELKLRGMRPGRNLIVKAEVKSSQMSEPLGVSESVTIYDDRN